MRRAGLVTNPPRSTQPDVVDLAGIVHLAAPLAWGDLRTQIGQPNVVAPSEIA